MAGLVFINGNREDKPGATFPEDVEINVKGDSCPYVSRGGLKLVKAMELYGLDLNDKVCMDIGASTGGFTDCMLKNGARKVYAIDVGYGQLDYKLRTDERVVNLEKTNVRYLDTNLIAEKIDFISIDVSFISLKLIFSVVNGVLSDDGRIVCLVKPQFEAGRSQVGKNGIIRDKKVHGEVIENVLKYAETNGLYPLGITYSPVTGAKGNIEYLMYLSKVDTGAIIDIDEIVLSSHEELK